MSSYIFVMFVSVLFVVVLVRLVRPICTGWTVKEPCCACVHVGTRQCTALFNISGAYEHVGSRQCTPHPQPCTRWETRANIRLCAATRNIDPILDQVLLAFQWPLQTTTHRFTVCHHIGRDGGVSYLLLFCSNRVTSIYVTLQRWANIFWY